MRWWKSSRHLQLDGWDNGTAGALIEAINGLLVEGPRVFLKAVLVFLGEGILLETVRRMVGSGAEVLFIAAMLLTGRRVLEQVDDTGHTGADTAYSSL